METSMAQETCRQQVQEEAGPQAMRAGLKQS